MQLGDRQPQRGFQPGDAERRAFELDCFSWLACGAWSVAIASTVPSASATTSDSMSAAERSGGFILQFVS